MTLNESVIKTETQAIQLERIPRYGGKIQWEVPERRDPVQYELRPDRLRAGQHQRDHTRFVH